MKRESVTARIWYLQKALLLSANNRTDLKHLIYFISSLLWDHTFFRHLRVLYIRLFTTSTALLRASIQNTWRLVSSLHCSLPKSMSLWLKISIVIYFSDSHAPCGYSYLRHPTNAVHVVLPLYFVYLKTKVHLIFEIHELRRCQQSIWNVCV